MSEIKEVAISKVKPNPKNPRVIKDDKFKKLVKSIEEFPGMLEKRPLVVTSDIDGKYVVLGGNMRLKAANEVGLKKIHIIEANDWTEEQKAEFLIKDNVSFGEWDWNVITTDWNSDLLNDWGLFVPSMPTEVDYSILDDEDVSEQLEQMANSITKQIKIEFEISHYEQALELVNFWKDRNAYIGGMIMEYLNAEKDKL
jgi:hypothetical protein